MTNNSQGRRNTAFGGVSLTSFLQMLEQERKSCTLTVSSAEGRTGAFYFADGELIDAALDNLGGMDAAHAILRWGKPTFTVGMPRERERRITSPLAHLLLDLSHSRGDEEPGGSEEPPGGSEPEPAEHPDPLVQKHLETIRAVSGIKHYYLLDRHGKIMTQSPGSRKLGDYIAYCIVSGIQMRKVINAKGPHRIQLNLDSGETLLVVPGSGLILGLLLDELASADYAVEQLRLEPAG